MVSCSPAVCAEQAIPTAPGATQGGYWISISVFSEPPSVKIPFAPSRMITRLWVTVPSVTGISAPVLGFRHNPEIVTFVAFAAGVIFSSTGLTIVPGFVADTLPVPVAPTSVPYS